MTRTPFYKPMSVTTWRLG